MLLRWQPYAVKQFPMPVNLPAASLHAPELQRLTTAAEQRAASWRCSNPMFRTHSASRSGEWSPQTSWSTSLRRH